MTTSPSSVPRTIRMSNVDRALAVGQVWPIFPVKLVPDPRPDDPEHLAKKPLIRRWQLLASQDHETIRGWSQQFPDAVIGILTGERSGLIVVDIDDPLALQASGLDLSDGVPVPTHPPGGTHYYFRPPLSGKLPPGNSAGGIDCRSEGNCVVLWGDPPDKSMLKPLPDAVAQFFFNRRSSGRSAGPNQVPKIIPEGGRNSTLASLAGKMRRRGMSEAFIRAALLEENDTRCATPLPIREVARIAASIARYEPVTKALPRAAAVSCSEQLTDVGNAKRLVANFGDMILYVPEFGRDGKGGWYIWDGSRWVKDTNGYIMELCKQTTYLIAEEWAGDLEQSRDTLEAEPACRKWAKTSQSVARLRAMRDLASTDPAVVVSAKDLDANKKLLNCTNGTIDLETHTLRAPDKADRITKSTGFEYHPDAQCPRWAGFLKWLTLGRAGLEEYLQRLLGYSLEGGNPERIVILLLGTGRNGKSTLLKTVREVLGDYARRVDKKTFLASGDGGTASPYVAQLPGLRFIYTSETEEGTRIAVGLVKDMTGNERIQARALYRDTIEFTPEFTPWIGTNEKPEIPAKDQALWDRWRSVPFDARVSDEDINVNFGDELLEEGEGILALLVEGHRRYSEDPGPDKFHTPEIVLNANREYREEMDDFAGFLTYLEDGEADGWTIDWSRGPLRDRYETWAKENDAPPLNARRFKAQMEAHGYKVKGERHTWRRDGWTSSDDAELAASLGFDDI